MAALQSAMFDERVVNEPHEFRTDRPWTNYLFFGMGQHECLGEHVARLVVPLLAKPLLRLDGLRHATGARGDMTWDRAFPESFTVEFDAA